MQEEILDKNTDAELKVYVVWEPMLPTDRFRRTRADLITDKRAVHFKDTERVSGIWYAENEKECPSLGDAAWDAYYLYGKDAKWDEAPEPLVSCGATLIGKSEKLMEAITPLLNE